MVDITKATANRFRDLFDRQKAYFNTDITKSYEWRIDQLDRLARMLVDQPIAGLGAAVQIMVKGALNAVTRALAIELCDSRHPYKHYIAGSDRYLYE